MGGVEVKRDRVKVFIAGPFRLDLNAIDLAFMKAERHYGLAVSDQGLNGQVAIPGWIIRCSDDQRLL